MSGAVAVFYEKNSEEETMQEEETFKNTKLELGREDGRAARIHLPML